MLVRCTRVEDRGDTTAECRPEDAAAAYIRILRGEPAPAGLLELAAALESELSAAQLDYLSRLDLPSLSDEGALRDPVVRRALQVVSAARQPLCAGPSPGTRALRAGQEAPPSRFIANLIAAVASGGLGATANFGACILAQVAAPLCIAGYVAVAWAALDVLDPAVAAAAQGPAVPADRALCTALLGDCGGGGADPAYDGGSPAELDAEPSDGGEGNGPDARIPDARSAADAEVSDSGPADAREQAPCGSATCAAGLECLVCGSGIGAYQCVDPGSLQCCEGAFVPSGSPCPPSDGGMADGGDNADAAPASDASVPDGGVPEANADGGALDSGPSRWAGPIELRSVTNIDPCDTANNPGCCASGSCRWGIFGSGFGVAGQMSFAEVPPPHNFRMDVFSYTTSVCLLYSATLPPVDAFTVPMNWEYFFVPLPRQLWPVAFRTEARASGVISGVFTATISSSPGACLERCEGVWSVTPTWAVTSTAGCQLAP